MKLTDRHAIGYFPLRGKSTYSDAYVEKPHQKDDYTYIPDQLRTGTHWFGRTTYGELYSQPGKDYFAKKVKVVEKRKDDPNDESLQYRNSITTQAPATKKSSSRSKIHSVRPRSSSRHAARAYIVPPNPILPRTVISRLCRRTSMRFLTPSTRMSDLILLRLSNIDYGVYISQAGLEFEEEDFGVLAEIVALAQLLEGQ